MKIVWSLIAYDDLRQIEDYVGERNPKAAERMAQAIRRSVESLARDPAMGRPGRVPGTRELVITRTPYVVIYTVSAERVEIAAVLHGRQKWPP